MGFNTLKSSNGAAEGLLGGSSINPFGSMFVAEQNSAAQGAFIFGINDTTWFTSSTGNGASVVAANGIVTCSSGISTSGSAGIRLRRGMKYRPGQGALGKFTAIFDSGSIGNTQVAGLGNPDCGYYFTKRGQDFGILHVDSAKKEIRKLTMSAAGGTENVTITLDGVPTTFAITGGSNINQTSYQISNIDYSQAGYGWDAEAIDGTIFFISNRPRALTGSYGITTSGTASGSFSVVQSGVTPTPTFISQSQWNIDKMDGTGDSRMVLDPGKGNVYSIGFQYLGFGNAIFSIEDTNKGIFVPVHQIKNANTRNTTVLRNPHTYLRWVSTNAGNSNSVSIKGGSGGLFTEGVINRSIGTSFATGSYKAGIGTTPVPILSIRPNQVFKNQACYGDVEPFNISVGADFQAAANTDLLNVLIYKNLILTGPVNFSYIDQNSSMMSSDVSATGFTKNSSQLLKSFIVPANNAVTFQLSFQDFFLTFKETITVVAYTTGNTAKVSVGLSWFEDQ